MARTLAERMRDPVWWLEQVGHMLIGAVAYATSMIGWSILGGACAGAWVGFWREREQMPIQSWGDTLVDFFATAAGGMLLGLVIWAVA